MEEVKNLDAVYVVTAKISKNKGITGGGVCIRSDGLMITTAMVTPAQCTDFSVRSRFSNVFRSATLLHVNYQFDIAVMMIDSVGKEEFGCIDLGDELSIEEGTELFSWIHSDNIVFSLITGNVAFPFKSVSFPEFTSKDTISTTSDNDLFSLRVAACSETLSFRTIGGVVKDSPVDRAIVSYLHPRLPVIEVHGFFCSPAVFDMSGSFIGLIMLQYCGMNYVLPSNMIKSYMMEALSGSSRQLEASSGSSQHKSSGSSQHKQPKGNKRKKKG